MSSSTLTPPRSSWSNLDWSLLGIACAVTLGIYFQTRNFQFINYDDYIYVSENRQVLHGLSWESFKWASTAIVAANWHPLTLYLELILSSLFGPQAGTYHLANTILQVINGGLLFAFLRYATGRSWPAFFTAILWAWHPLRVESVAWVSELKDVLCGFFFLLCLIAYVRYTRRRTIRGYVAVAVLHAAALLSKPMAVTLPAVLLLLDYWPLAEKSPSRPLDGWLLRTAEKIPLLALSIADIAYALVTQKNTHAIGSSSLFPVSLRLRNAVVSAVFYIRDTFVPTRLSLFYPHPAMVGKTVSWTAAALSVLLLLAATAVVIVRRKDRYLIVGWLWFLGCLTPVVGLIQIGEQARADRYTYLPSIGLTFAVVWLAADFASRRGPLKSVAAAAAGLVGIVLAVVAHGDVSYWKNSRSLFSRSSEVIPDNYLALSIEADVTRVEGDPQRALMLAGEAMRVSPESAVSQITYGYALKDCGRLDEAVVVARHGIEISNRTYQLWDLLGVVRDDQANRVANEAADLPPDDPKVAALAITEADFRAKAMVDFKQARLAADLSGVEYILPNYHMAYEQTRTGKIAEGIAGMEKVLSGYPLFRPAHNDLANAFWLEAAVDADLSRVMGKMPFPSEFSSARSELTRRSGPLLENAVDHYLKAYELGERDPGAEIKLAWLVCTNGQFPTGLVRSVIPAAQDAVERNRNDPLALDALAAGYARLGQIDAAVNTAGLALDAAKAANKPALARQIAARLDRYKQGLMYLFGDDQPFKPSPGLTAGPSR